MSEENPAKPASAWRFLEHVDAFAPRYLVGYLLLYAVFGMSTVGFYPSFSWPAGDEGTYLDYAMRPWTLTSEFFEGFPPKEVQNPYNFRLFLNPFSLIFSVFGFTYVGARLLCLAYGIVIIWLVYRFAATFVRRSGGAVGGNTIALFTAIVFSLLPQSMFFTHGIRPEGMFTMFLMIVSWVALRRDDGPTDKTWFAVGLLSASMLWVHFNGVTAPLIFFAVMLFHDRRALSWRKVTAFVLGGAAFLVVFMAVNFLPALDTVREFGVMPVTFVSSNKMPITELGDIGLFDLIGLTYRSYAFQWTNPLLAGPLVGGPGGYSPGVASALLFLPAAFALVRGHRTARSFGVVLGMIVVMMIFIIPNKRPEYVYYLLPFVFVLGAVGLARIPLGVARAGAAAALLGFAGISFVISNADHIARFAGYREANLKAEAKIQEIVARYGDPAEVTVMGTQEFRAAVPDVRFRTFHSLLTTKSFDGTIELLDPEVVIFWPRAVNWVATPSQVYAHIRSRKERIDTAWRDILASLQARGYRFEINGEHDGHKWNGKSLYIFSKRPK